MRAMTAASASSSAITPAGSPRSAAPSPASAEMSTLTATGVPRHTASYTRPKLPRPIWRTRASSSQRTSHCRTAAGRRCGDGDAGSPLDGGRRCMEARCVEMRLSRGSLSSECSLRGARGVGGQPASSKPQVGGQR